MQINSQNSLIYIHVNKQLLYIIIFYTNEIHNLNF